MRVLRKIVIPKNSMHMVECYIDADEPVKEAFSLMSRFTTCSVDQDDGILVPSLTFDGEPQAIYCVPIENVSG